MRIVIDLQNAQIKHSTSHYSLALAQTIVRNCGDREVFIVLNGMLPDKILSIRTAFEGLLSQENIHTWYAPEPLKAGHDQSGWRRLAAEYIRESLVKNLQADAVYVNGFFFGYHEDAVVTSFGSTAPSLAVLLPCDNDFSTDIEGLPHSFRQEQFAQLRRATLCINSSTLSNEQLAAIGDIDIARISDATISGKIDTPAHQLDADAQYVLKLLDEISNSSRNAVTFNESLPRLAYVSPLPPEKTGIADYSAQLLPALSNYYAIDVVVDQPSVSNDWISTHCGILSPSQFLANAHRYDRVIYHFGNSSFHFYMIDLLVQIPGVVVLHDFFLGELSYCREHQELIHYGWSKDLYHTHGYGALRERFCSGNTNIVDLVSKYPCNGLQLERALGVILHSEYARKLSRLWYGDRVDRRLRIVPMLRESPPPADRITARTNLAIIEDAFVISSFGRVGSTKQNQRLISAWLKSQLALDPNCRLIFVGENDTEDYGVQTLEMIRNNGMGNRIHITGWVSDADFQLYLAATDVAVQLRINSRGETSAAVLDCMNNGLPTIANANGSMAELPPDTVWLLPDEFSEDELVEALNLLWVDRERRAGLGAAARAIISQHHNPKYCAEHYATAIEDFYRRGTNERQSLIQKVVKLEEVRDSYANLANLARCITQTLSVRLPIRQIFIDISVIARDDFKTGIQRVIRAIIIEWIKSPPKNFRIEPVYLSDEGGYWHFRYARKATLAMLGCPTDFLSDDLVDFCNGDILFGLDLTGHYVIETDKVGLYQQLRRHGVRILFVVYDLLPILRPDVFPPEDTNWHEWWLRAATRSSDTLICISQSVAEELDTWLDIEFKDNKPKTQWFHLGADIGASIPTTGTPADADELIQVFEACPTFLMVGTLEPRKGHLQTIKAFEILWQQNININLVLIGKEGWSDLPHEKRRTIPLLIETLRHHPQRDIKLFWLNNVSDEFLQKIYGSAVCLIAASEGEGFGLPLIEAAQHKLPLIVRDIPVFREVAGDHAHYFQGLRGEDLATSIHLWLKYFNDGAHPQSTEIPWLSWQQSAQQLQQLVIATR